MQDNSVKNKYKVNIEYCKSCDTHSWCTHHNEEKYKQVYLELVHAISRQFPGLPIAGNQLPVNLVPIKAKENKYYDSQDKKYVIFPSIGAFEVYLNKELLFSKKANNTWPTNAEILNQIHIRIKGCPRRTNTEQSDETAGRKYEISQKQQKQTVKMADEILSNIDRNSTFYRGKQKKQLTLTDHFRKYKMRQRSQDDLESLYAESETPTGSTISPITAEDIRRLHQIWGKKENLPNFIKDKAFIELREGKKEMLVNLSSIEEENELKQTVVAPKAKKNKISNLQIEFEKLENKLRKFQYRVSEVNSRKFGFEPNNQIQQSRQKKGSKFSFMEKIQQVKTAYNTQKFVKLIKDKKKRMIEEYIHATSEEKNEKLQQIYGPQYLKPNMGISKIRPKNSRLTRDDQSFNLDNQSSKKQSEKSSSENSFSEEQEQEQSCSDVPTKPKKREIAYSETKNLNPKNTFNLTHGNFQTNNKPVTLKNKLASDKNIEAHKFLSPFERQKRQFQSRSLVHQLDRNKLKINPQENNRKTEADDNKLDSKEFKYKNADQNKQIIINYTPQNQKEPFLKKASKSSFSFNKKQKHMQKQRNDLKGSQLADINQIQQFEETQRNLNQQSKRSNSSKQSKSKKNKYKELTPEIISKHQDQRTELKKSSKKKNSQLIKTKFQEKSQSMQMSKQTTKKQRKIQKKSKDRVNSKQKLKDSQLSNRFTQTNKLNKPKKQKGKKIKQSPSKNQENQQQIGQQNANQNQNTHSEQSYEDSQKSGSLEDQKSFTKQQNMEHVNEKNQKENQVKPELIQLKNVMDASEVETNEKCQIQHQKQKSDQPQTQTHHEKHTKRGGAKDKKKNQQSKQEPEMPIRQENNVGLESKPRRIFEIDEERPQVVDVAVQKNYRIPARQKASQTLHSNEGSFESNQQQSVQVVEREQNRQSPKMGKNLQRSGIKQNKSQIRSVQKTEERLEMEQEQISFENESDQSISQPKQQSKSMDSSQVKANQKFVELRNQQQIQTKQGINLNEKNDRQAGSLNKHENHSQHKNQKPQIKIIKQKASITKQLCGKEYQSKLKSEVTIKSQNNWDEAGGRIQIKQLYKKKGKLFQKDAVGFDKLIFKDERLSNLSKIIKILCQKNQFLIIRLFENPEHASADSFKIWLCHHYTWNCYEASHATVDSSLQPLFVHHQGFQKWPIILVEALIIMSGGLDKLCQASVSELFHALTGSSYLSFKVKEDPGKNARLLKFISQNEKKNFIIRAQKRMHCSLGESIEQKKQSSSFFILSQKTVNENQILLRMKKTNSEAFWIKLQKFVSQFCQVDVLQLRVNHNFCSISLNNCSPGHFKIVEFVFAEECFGSVVAVTETKSTDFKLYLYKEEQDSVLRLVGQASDKNKKITFFDCCFDEGKYLLFTDIKWPSNKICYMGEGHPKMSIKEEIKQLGLKSDYTEYIPIATIPEKKQTQMPTFLNMTRKSQKSSMLNIESGSKDRKSKQQSLNREKLREQFVDFLANNS